ncbi:MAG: helix-turn-helix domain-containing protein [Desulfitobacterium sp.]
MIEVGKSIRAIRKRRNLTTTQLAQQLELSNGYISLIERDIVSPSLATLKRIAQILNVPVESFFLDPDSEVVYSHLKMDKQEFLHSENKNWRLLINPSPKDRIGAYCVDMSDLDKKVYSHEGVELLYVLEGESPINVGKEDYHLKAGDALYFDASILHWDAKDVELPRKLIVVVTPPEEFHFNSTNISN